jgi:hypothetical protein
MFPGVEVNEEVQARVAVLTKLGVSAAALVLAVTQGCNSHQVGDGITPAGDLDAAPYEAAPRRQVVGDGPIGGGGQRGGGADGASDDLPGGGGSGGSYRDASRMDVVRLDTLGDERPAPDTAPGCTACDLLAQSCSGVSQGCYPAGGGACCVPRGALDEGGTCLEDDQCDRGLVCIDYVCRMLCSIYAPRCGPSCMPLAGQSGVGYCAP